VARHDHFLMRSFVLVVVVLTLFASTIAEGEARGRRPAKHTKTKKRVATDVPAPREVRERRTLTPREQSIGAPWSGHLARSTRLRGSDGFMIRRPWRAFATRTTVELVRRAVTDTVDMFPDAHVIAIGDLSAKHGGAISDHRSHQSGRDADIGLIYKTKPAGYPQNFITATAKNLDCGATWQLISAFAATAGDDGGAQVIFLDYNVQRLIYAWARKHKVPLRRLERVFQFPRGRDVSDGLVRHAPNHDDHLHVRFRCASADTGCR
jgi:hypothetical protein